MLFDPGKVKEAFQLPENIRPLCLLAVGYPSKMAQPYRPWHDVFRDMSDIATEL